MRARTSRPARCDMPLLEALVWLGILTFAAMGALTAVSKRFDLVGVVVLAGVTAVGGGVLRDLLSGQVPMIFHRHDDLYASAAALGAAAVYAIHHALPQYAGLGVLTGALAAAALRIGGRWLKVDLPRA